MDSPRPSIPVARSDRGLLSFEALVRAHPRAILAISSAAVLAIAAAKLYTETDFFSALTYGIPLVVCAYAVGFRAGIVMAVVVTVLWLLDSLVGGRSMENASYAFVARLASNLGVAAVAALGGAAAQARAQHLAGQQQLEELRADLVSAFSHDLRTPLAAIVGYAELLRDGPDSGARAPTSTLERILMNARHLDQLISDIVAIEQVKSSTVVQASDFGPEALVAELRTEFDLAPHIKPVTLEWRVDAQTPAFHTDRTKLTSVVRNLVSNALKYTDSGRVLVHIGYLAASGRHVVEVEDTGPGISPEEMPHVFERFRRGSGSPPGGGFGLGLYIVRRLAAVLGATVDVRSELGRGACFVVIVPTLQRPESQQVDAART
jgi:signal transduction histidine kinase